MSQAHAYNINHDDKNKHSQERDVRIMIVEDDPDLREALADTLELSGFSISQCEHAEAAVKMLERKTNFDLIISDVNMGDMSGHDLLKHVRAKYPQIPMVLATAYASINDSVDAIKEGAVDYLVKPIETKSLLKVVKKVVGHQVSLSDEPIANSAASKNLLQLAARVAQSDSTALIIGESGTGKEVLARYVHVKSPRADQPFIAINCAAIPENMLEAMLFGYEKGAYTGATQASPGKFEQANGGTLLLDEISEMDISLQAKLLRVLQEREVERLGGRKSIQLDVRVIATSNRDMRREVAEGKFREDLYFRLSVLPLQWAPLRDRKEDILPLAQSLLQKHTAKQYRKGVTLAPETVQALCAYGWPGNVRELDNVMQRALILQPNAVIYPQDLGLHSIDTYSEKPSLIDEPNFSASVASFTHHTMISHSNPVQNEESSERHPPATDYTHSSVVQEPDTAALGDDLRKRELEIIINTLRESKGSKKNTAEKLGISPRTLRYKLAKFKADGYEIAV